MDGRSRPRDDEGGPLIASRRDDELCWIAHLDTPHGVRRQRKSGQRTLELDGGRRPLGVISAASRIGHVAEDDP
ncbi:MAG TPA: hypothetical protein VD790_10025 [Thermoleophilaceae bacterium]|nr:hypothetical protein [Thermoleophilaceae bacterium]